MISAIWPIWGSRGTRNAADSCKSNCTGEKESILGCGRGKTYVIASDCLPSCTSGEGSEAPASPRRTQLLQNRGRGGVISQPIDKENDSDKGKGNRYDEKPDCPGPPDGLPGEGFVGFDENPKPSKPPPASRGQARNHLYIIRPWLARNR
jgi:hypothetical protein